MKKIIITTAIFMFSNLGAIAMIDSDYSTSEQYLLNRGYSPETIRLINIRKKNPYALPEVKEENVTQKSSWYAKKLWHYIDPAADNGNFGNSHINPDGAAVDENL
jgi:hypothetical protein